MLAPYIKRGDFVKIGKQELVFYHQKGIYHLPLEKATVITLNVKTFFMKKSELVLLKRILEKQQLEKQIGLPLDKKARAIFEEMRGLRVNWHAVTSYLVGRGGGGTPSGDDILVAYLALLYATDQPEARLLAQALSGELATPDVSRAYLIAATKGYVNSLMYELFLNVKTLNASLVEESMHRLMAIGHSSGKDLSFGLLLAVESSLYLNEKRLNQYDEIE